MPFTMKSKLTALLAFWSAITTSTVHSQAPPIPNINAPVAVILIDPTNGKPYRVGQADITVSVVQIPNINAPQGSTLINPITGVPYH